MPCAATQNLPPESLRREEREARAAANDRFVMLAGSGQEGKIRAALESGAALDWKDNQGSTALMRAAANGHCGCVAILLAPRSAASSAPKRI